MDNFEAITLGDTSESAVNGALELAHKLGGKGFEDMAEEDALESPHANAESYSDEDIMKMVDHTPQDIWESFSARKSGL